MDKFTCEMLANLVTDYLEGALSTAESQRFEVHLQRCPPCETYLVQFRRTITACGQVNLESIDPQVKSALLSAFEDWKTSRR